MAKTKVREDLVGKTFGRLLVLDQVDDYITPSGSTYAKWLCQCSCGSCPIEVVQSSLRSGNTSSCGCLRKEVVSNEKRKHGLCKTKEYKAWLNMVHRCTNSKIPNYPDYGGRGITICDRWLNSFESFLEDMGECAEGMSLDRIDVEGNYHKENCRWASRSEQNYNQRKKKTNTSGRTGVYFDARFGKWVAEIHKCGAKVYLGMFRTIQEASKAREDAEIEIYGYSKE